MSQGQDAQDKIRELEERVRAQQKELGRLRQVEIQVDYFKGQFERVKRDRAELEKLYDDHIAKCAGIVIKEDFPSYTPQNFRNVEPPHTHAPTRNVEPLIVPATSSSVQSSLNQLTAHPNHSPAVSHAKPPSKANHIVETHVMTGVHAPYPSPMNEPDMHTSAQTIKLDTENSTASSLRIKRETLSRTVPDPEPKLGDTSSTVPTLIDLTKTEVTNSPMPTQSNSSAPDVAKANIPTASSDGTDTVGRASSNGATTPPAKKAKLVSLPTPPPLPPVLPAKTDPPTFITNPIPDAHVNVIDRTLAGAIAPVNTAASADVSATSSATTSNELARKCYPPLEATAKTPQHNILAGVAKPAAASHGIPHIQA
ncbi:hypothetical protein BD410DRAFT_1164 [Rickenella mellea]|uniref:Uncharacterized protein n=1 Tax=Rickenella mellea TaxID=50990 RepID=A0A4R5XFD8_9AGAM|nr:hypothetical protein BD410DRAFT_1164 [Rickenella mellea]